MHSTFSCMEAYAFLLPVLLAVTASNSLAIRQSTGQITSGNYIISGISIPGFHLGATPGPFVGVQDPTSSNESTYVFTITESSQGYTIYLPSGDAVVESGKVGLTTNASNNLWNIVPLDNGLHTVETTDGSLRWILPHDAPINTPVSLDSAADQLIPSEYWVFIPSD